jgi:hypothetical protein
MTMLNPKITADSIEKFMAGKEFKSIRAAAHHLFNSMPKDDLEAQSLAADFFVGKGVIDYTSIRSYLSLWRKKHGIMAPVTNSGLINKIKF